MATGSIFGAGAGRRLASVQWSVAGQMAVAWLLTLPAAAVVGAVAAWLAGTGTVGTIIVALVLVGLAAGIYAASRRRPVTADNVNDVPAPQAGRRRGLIGGPRTCPSTGERSASSPSCRSPSACSSWCWCRWRWSGCRPASPRRAANASPRTTRPIIGRGGSTLSPTAGTAVAVVCLLGAAAIVLYGLYVIVF